MINRQRLISLSACLLMLMVFTACQQQTNVEPPTRVPSLTPPPPTETATPTAVPTVSAQNVRRTPRTNAEDPLQQAYVRIVNAGVELPAINLEIQGLFIASNLTFALTTSPTGIEAGDYSITISTADNPTLIQREITINGGDSKILMVTGTESAPNLSIFDENLDPLNEDESRVKFINAIANGPSVSVQADSTTITTPLDFGQLSAPTVLATGSVSFVFQNNGQAFFSYDTSLRSRRSTTLILLGSVDTPQVIEFGEPVTGISPIRFIHASPDLPAVDIYLDNELVMSNLGFTRSTERQILAAKSYTLNLFLTGETSADSEPLLTSIFNAVADQPTSLVVAGTMESPLAIRVSDNLDMIRPGEARISFLNPLEQYPNVNIAFTGGTVPDIPDFLGFGQVSPPAELPADSYTISWTDVTQTETGEIVELAENIELEAGRSYLYVLTALEDSQPLVFSEPITIDESLLDVPVDVTVTPAPSRPTRLRFVNANDNALTTNIYVDTLEIASALGYGSGTDYIIAPSGVQTITASNSETETPLAIVNYDFAVATDYSIFIYGYALDEYRIAVVEDNNVVFNQSNNASVRMVNLSNDTSLVFQLGYGEASGSLAPEASTTDTGETVRPSVPFGISRISSETESGFASLQTQVQSGDADLFVIDPRANTVAGVFPSVSLSERTIYDLVIYQDLFSSRIKGFLVDHNSP